MAAAFRLLGILGILLTAAPAWASEPGSGIYRSVYDSVNRQQLEDVLKDMTGVTPVQVDGKVYSITDRYTPESKQKFRAYWMQYFRALGIDVQEMTYPTQHHIGETNGHNLEAVLPGQSKDSVVIIVHYDSMGPRGSETANPAADDDMTGMSVTMETARILAQYRGRLLNTVRFVAADYEEQTFPGLEGARVYAKYLHELSAKEGFKIVAAVDNEQSGWNCAKDNLCFDESSGNTFDVFSCSGDGNGFDFKAMGDQLEGVARQFSDLQVNRDCLGQNSDHYAMWEVGVPSVVYSEHAPFNNPHFDDNGGDLFSKIDLDYFYRIARVGVTFATELVGIL